MRIGELAKISGLAPSRIRFYEASGLISSVERKANGYRDYAPDTEWVLQLITSAQAAGFSLEEIRQLMPMDASGWRHDELLTGLKQKVEEISALEERLAQNKAQLLRVIEGIEGKPEGMACADNAQMLINRLREEGVGQASGKRAVTSSTRKTPARLPGPDRRKGLSARQSGRRVVWVHRAHSETLARIRTSSFSPTSGCGGNSTERRRLV